MLSSLCVCLMSPGFLSVQNNGYSSIVCWVQSEASGQTVQEQRGLTVDTGNKV